MPNLLKNTIASAINFGTLLKSVCVPPEAIKVLQRQMDINRSAILVSTALLFLARAIEFKLNEILATFLISSGLAVFAYIFEWSAKAISKRGGKPPHSRPKVQKWAAYLIAVWIVALALIIVLGGLNILFGLPTLANFLRGALPAAVSISLMAVLLAMLKTKYFDHKGLGSFAQIATYFIVGIIINSVMLYFFVYLTW